MKKEKSYWVIDGDNNHFNTLSNAKWHCNIAYTPKERIKYLTNCHIYHIKADCEVSYVEIKIDCSGNLKFGRTIKNELKF